MVEKQTEAHFTGNFPDEKIYNSAKASGFSFSEEQKPVKKKLSKGVLFLTDKNIRYNEIVIPIEDISEAVFYVTTDPVGRKSMKLKLHISADRYFIFSMKFEESWFHQQVIPFRIEYRQTFTDLPGLLLRILALVVLLYFMYKAWGQ